MRILLLALLLSVAVMGGTSCEESRAQMMQTGPTNEQPRNPELEKLAKAIVAAIATDNYAAFTDLLVTQREYVALMRASTHPGDEIKANDSVAVMQKVYKTARRSFDEIRENGTRDGIVWERAQYKSVRYNLDTLHGVEFVRMVIVIGFRGAEYPITASEVMKTTSGWKVLGRIRYGERDIYARYGDPEEIARRMQDSIHKADSLVAREMMRLADSIIRADSLAATQAKRWQDSINEADRKKAEEEKSGKRKPRSKK